MVALSSLLPCIIYLIFCSHVLFMKLFMSACLQPADGEACEGRQVYSAEKAINKPKSAKAKHIAGAWAWCWRLPAASSYIGSHRQVTLGSFPLHQLVFPSVSSLCKLKDGEGDVLIAS